MLITNTVAGDLDVLEELFRQAIQYQQTKTANSWHGMNRPLIEQEIRERMHWKIVEADQIACFFSVLYSDRLIWDEKDADPSIYLHRIVTNPSFRGKGYVKHILAWAEEFGRANGKQYVRLDTGRDNRRLNDYYRECGFVFCGIKQFDDENNPAIPRHYLGSGLSLFEKRIV